MQTRDASDLRHDETLGEVSPRSYPLVLRVKLGCEKIGSHPRLEQVKYLLRTLDLICSDAGETRARIHLTAEPGTDPKDAIEVRIQALTSHDVKTLVESIRKRLPEVVLAGERCGWKVLE